MRSASRPPMRWPMTPGAHCADNRTNQPNETVKPSVKDVR